MEARASSGRREAAGLALLIALVFAVKLWVSAWFPVSGEGAYSIVGGLEPGWAGALLGLAFLSKSCSALRVLVFIADAAAAPRSEGAWRGLAVTLLAAVPFGVVNLWWNYEHCWANFMFNLYNRHEAPRFSV